MKLDELIALNDEMIALSRAGVPLGSGLLQLGGDLPGKLGQVATRIGQQLERGESLEQALANREVQAPAVYRAIVLAGLRSGNLTASLEAIASALRRIVELRRTAGLALLYPLIVALTAVLLFAFVLQGALGALQTAVVVQDVASDYRWGPWLAWAATYGHWAWVAVPVLLMLAGIWWWSSGQAGKYHRRTALRLLPGASRLLRTSRTAALADVLSLLVAQRVPLPEALPLAAETCGDAGMQRDARQLAEALAHGRHVTTTTRRRQGIPPLIRWLLTSPVSTGDLAKALRRIAQRYYHSAQFQGDAARIYLPVFATLVLGGTVTAVYALAFFGPWMALLRLMGRP